MQDVNKKLVWSTAILALLLIGVLGFMAGMFFGGKKAEPAPAAVAPGTTDPGTATAPAPSGGGTDSGKTDSGKTDSGKTESPATAGDPGSSGSSGSGSSGSGGGSGEPESPWEKLTPTQILYTPTYWADETGWFGLMATAGGEFDIMVGDQVYHSTQVMSGFEDVYNGFTYNIIIEMENYQDGVIATLPFYCYQDENGGVHMQVMSWTENVFPMEPSETNPLAKFAQ